MYFDGGQFRELNPGEFPADRVEEATQMSRETVLH